MTDFATRCLTASGALPATIPSAGDLCGCLTTAQVLQLGGLLVTAPFDV